MSLYGLASIICFHLCIQQLVTSLCIPSHPSLPWVSKYGPYNGRLFFLSFTTFLSFLTLLFLSPPQTSVLFCFFFPSCFRNEKYRHHTPFFFVATTCRTFYDEQFVCFSFVLIPSVSIQSSTLSVRREAFFSPSLNSLCVRILIDSLSFFSFKHVLRAPLMHAHSTQPTTHNALLFFCSS